MTNHEATLTSRIGHSQGGFLTCNRLLALGEFALFGRERLEKLEEIDFVK